MFMIIPFPIISAAAVPIAQPMPDKYLHNGILKIIFSMATARYM